MPTINIPPRLRFALYLIGVLGAVAVQYAMDKAWFGEAEMRLWSGVAAVLFALAAAKTSLSDDSATVTGTVVSETGETGTIAATLAAPDQPTEPPCIRTNGIRCPLHDVDHWRRTDLRDPHGT